MFHIILDCIESYKSSSQENVRMLSREEKESHSIQDCHCVQITFEKDLELFAYLPDLTRQLLVILSGHDLNKIDFAIPQSYCDENHDRIYTQNDWAVWSYESDKLRGGEPIHYKQLMSEFTTRVRKAIVKQLNS